MRAGDGRALRPRSGSARRFACEALEHRPAPCHEPALVDGEGRGDLGGWDVVREHAEDGEVVGLELRAGLVQRVGAEVVAVMREGAIGADGS